MAKKVVATLKKEGGVKYAKIYKCVKSEKTGAYTFRSEVVTDELAKQIMKG